MSATKIRFNIFNLLFRLFSFLADQTNGWSLFVKPKLLFGSLMVGLGISACSVKERPNGVQAGNNVVCYDTTFIEAVDTAVMADTGSILNDSGAIELIHPKVATVLCYYSTVSSTDKEKEVPIGKDSMKVYTFVEQMPEFPGGGKALIEFINKELRIPMISCYEGGIQGVVYCRFIVEKDGTISNIGVVKSLDPGLDKEAVRVIECMPQWIPGKQDGKPVRVYYTIPVRFKIY